MDVFTAYMKFQTEGVVLQFEIIGLWEEIVSNNFRRGLSVINIQADC